MLASTSSRAAIWSSFSTTRFGRRCSRTSSPTSAPASTARWCCCTTRRSSTTKSTARMPSSCCAISGSAGRTASSSPSEGTGRDRVTASASTRFRRGVFHGQSTRYSDPADRRRRAARGAGIAAPCLCGRAPCRVQRPRPRDEHPPLRLGDDASAVARNPGEHGVRLDFPTYIKNLLRGKPDVFNAIFKKVKGGAQYTPVTDHLDGAVAFIASLDLNNGVTYAPAPGGPIGQNTWGGTVSQFFQAYQWTVVQIENNA